jgi:hypothetical protein
MSRIALPLLVALASACLPVLGAPRAFVASDGSDANPCTLNSPCRNFQAAHNAVDVGGEVVALDSAGFGSLTITKSVTITSSPGAYAGIAVGSGEAVSIATAGVNVVLRGLHLSNTGPGIGGGTTGGVHMSAGNSLAVENCVLSRFNFGVRVDTDARVKIVDTLFRASGSGFFLSSGATAEVSGSKFLGNEGGGFGVFVSGTAGTTTSATIVDTVSSDNFSGFVATTSVASATVRLSCLRCTASNNAQIGFLNGASSGGTAQMLVGSSLASYNGQFGLYNSALTGGIATFESLGNNALHQNTLGPTSGTITTVTGF